MLSSPPVCWPPVCWRPTEDVSGDGGLDVLIAGQPCQPDRLIGREQPGYVVVRVIAERRGWPGVTEPAEAAGARPRLGWGVRIISEQDQSGGTVGRAVPGQGRGQVTRS